MGFHSELRETAVASLPLRDAIAIDKHLIARAAIAMMRSNGLGCAVVVDARCRPEGIFTERSVIRLLNEKRCLDRTPVLEYLDPAFFVVRSDAPVAAVWDAVVNEGARFVCVVDDDRKLVALTGQRGLSEFACDCFGSEVSSQRLGSKPWMMQREGA